SVVFACAALPGRWRIVGWLAAIHLAATLLHPYKEARFLATAVPFLYLLAALPVAASLAGLLRSRAARVAGALALAAGLVLLVATERGAGASDAWMRRRYLDYSVDARFHEALDAIARL